MRTQPSSPYLLPPDEAVDQRPWGFADGQLLPDRLEHWDPFTQLELVRTVEVDTDLVRGACGLGADAAFALTASWASDRTRLSGRAAPAELGRLGGVVRAPLALTVNGALAGGRLELQTRLILRSPGPDATVISPRREGAVLWRDAQRVALEGSAARFPITALDFHEVHRLPGDASWTLEWNAEDLEAPVLGGMRLLVNTSNELLINALRSGSADGRAAAVRGLVMYDVARSLVEGALSNERFVEEPDIHDEGTIGRMLSELLDSCWTNVPVRTIAARHREDPSRLWAELQAHLRVLA